MASGDGRYGQPDAGPGKEVPDLWGEDAPAWDPTQAYYPGTVVKPRHAAEPPWSSRPRPFGTTGENPGVPGVDPDRLRGDPRWHTQPPPGEAGGPTPRASRTSQSRLDSLVRPIRRRSATSGDPGQPGPRHSSAPTDTVERTAADATYGYVLGLTAAWYLVPLLLTTFWLIFLDTDRRTLAFRALLTNLPWEFAAFILSLGVAALLRLASISWRAWTLAFAAGIIGAGLATVAHSFTV
jgi:hypothetical protein